MRNPPRIARTVLRPKRRPDPRRASQHLAFIRQLECMACGHPAPSEAAHVRSSGDGGVGMKPGDRFSVPLCAVCHRTGKRSQHSIGEVAFFASLNIDPVDTALRLWTVSGDIAAGQRIIFRARQAIALHALGDGS